MKAPRGTRLLVPLLSFLALASCQKPVVVVVGPELPGLQPVVQSLLGQAQGLGSVAVVDEAKGWPKDAILVRITTTPNGNLSPGVPPGLEIPDQWQADAGSVLPGALVRLARSPSGSWGAIPLFFDLWGQTRFDLAGAQTLPPTTWEGFLAGTPAQGAVAAGSRPSFRQWVLAAGSTDPGFRFTDLRSWFNQPAEGWESELTGLAAQSRAGLWVPNTWSLSAQDVLQSYLPGSRLTFVETFRDYESVNGSVDRQFFPFRKTLASGYAVGGTAVFAEVRSSGSEDWKAALPVLRWLAGTAFQREAAAKTKWLAANLNTPELDGTGAAARGLVTQAQAFVPLTDRLPSPLVEGNLFVEAQLAVDKAPRP